MIKWTPWIILELRCFAMNSLADSTEKLSKVYNSTRRPLCDEAYEAIKLLLAERGQPQPDRFPHQNTTELFKRETIPMIIGLILGTILGFLLRPSVPLIGQLPFGVVVTRG